MTARGIRAIAFDEFDGVRHRLTEPVLITVGRRLIGMWEPGGDEKSVAVDRMLMERDAARLLALFSKEEGS